ncbi:MAG TPA: nucleoside-triphosphatase [Glaciihabitans sp.]|nr:nucleoside-triphosphatase [Glaciihabitans sp.]
MSAPIAPLTSIDEVVRSITELANRSAGRIIVGVTGAPGSGKSTLCAQLVEALGASAALLPMDGFHLQQARLVELGRRDRMGAPDTFDVDGFVAALHAVRAADLAHTAVTVPGFDRESEEAIADAITISADAGIVVVDGN